MGYNPQGHKEWDTTERLHIHFHFLYNIDLLTSFNLMCH